MSENAFLMLRPGRLLPLLALVAAVAAALIAPGIASARESPVGAPFRVLVVNRISDSAFARLGHRGAVGVLRPGFGPTTDRTRAFAELVRGAELNARLVGTPPGKPLIAASPATAAEALSCHMCIVLELPPRGGLRANDRLYRIAVIGRGYHGVLTSPMTRIPGLVSIVDVAPTALGRLYNSLSWVPASAPVVEVNRLDAQIHGEDRLKYAGLFIVAGLLILLAVLGWTAARTAIPAALLANLLPGVFHVTNEVAIVAVFTVATVLAALVLARVCRDTLALLGLVAGVVLLYALVYVKRPEWAAVTPLGPDQNLRFWGIGDQIGTLLIAPLLMGALIARQRLGWIGFAAVSLLGLLVMTDNRLGANGGGAIGLGLALAVLGARLTRRGWIALVTSVAVSSVVVLAIVKHGLASPGPNHLRSAFGKGIGGFVAVAEHRVPLVYEPAVHDWPLTLPLAVLLIASGVIAFRVTRARAARDLLLAVATGVLASLLINDATGFMLTGGIACACAVARFVPTGAPVRLPVLARLRRAAPAAEPVPAESPPG